MRRHASRNRRGATLRIAALLVVLALGCTLVRDARVSTLYVTQSNQLAKKVGDADATIYNQTTPTGGSVAIDFPVSVLSATELDLWTYTASKLVARDALGGGNLDRVRIHREALAPDPAELVAEFVASDSSNAALAEQSSTLFVGWVRPIFGAGGRLVLKQSGNGTSWQDTGEVVLPAFLDGIDLAPLGTGLLLAGFEQDGAVVAYQITLNPLANAGRLPVRSGKPLQRTGQVSLATRGTDALVVFGSVPEDEATPVGDACNTAEECESLSCRDGLCVAVEGGVTELCNLDSDCQSLSCVRGRCQGGPISADATPGRVSMVALSLDPGTRGVTQQLWESPRLPVLRWVSAARVVEGSDDPAPNDHVVVAWRGRRQSDRGIFLCKWSWPTGAAPSWTLTPTDCPDVLRLNDPALRLASPVFDLCEDRFLRSPR